MAAGEVHGHLAVRPARRGLRRNDHRSVAQDQRHTCPGRRARDPHLSPVCSDSGREGSLDAQSGCGTRRCASGNRHVDHGSCSEADPDPSQQTLPRGLPARESAAPRKMGYSRSSWSSPSGWPVMNPLDMSRLTHSTNFWMFLLLLTSCEPAYVGYQNSSPGYAQRARILSRTRRTHARPAHAYPPVVVRSS